MNETLKQKLDPMWLLSCTLVTAIASFLRFFMLELKPFHHDEGVNGYFMVSLYNTGQYAYNPTNYHGPDLYFVALAFANAMKFDTFTMRFSVAVFGVAVVVLAFFLRDYLGKVGSIFAALFLSLSPGMVFISRYFIHEMLFVFFSIGIVVPIVLFIEKKKAGPFAVGLMILTLLVCFLPGSLRFVSAVIEGNTVGGWVLAIALALIDVVLTGILIRQLLAWNEGRPMYLLLASASTVMLFATKETAFVTVGTMAIAVGCVAAWRRIGTPVTGALGPDPAPVGLTWSNFKSQLGSRDDVRWTVILCSLLFAYLWCIFFSSFFTNPRGIVDAFKAYAVWTKTGAADHTQNGFFAYLKWGYKIEAPIFALSAVGAVIALVKGVNRFAIFTAFWAFGMLAAYTIIPYKTPWLALSFLLPMCLIGGYAINETLASKNTLVKLLGGLLAVTATGVLAYQTYLINFVKYDDESMPYVYAHTKRGFLDLVAEMNRIAEKDGGRYAKAQVMSSEYWPMPWYTKDLREVAYAARIGDAKNDVFIVTRKGDKEDEVIRRFSKDYKYVGTYPLRSGVDLHLLVRRDLAESDAKEIVEGLRR